MGLTYKDSGVDKEKGYEEVQIIKEIVKKTHGKEVLTGIGGFAGLFKPEISDMKEPVWFIIIFQNFFSHLSICIQNNLAVSF